MLELMATHLGVVYAIFMSLLLYGDQLHQELFCVIELDLCLCKYKINKYVQISLTCYTKGVCFI